METARRLDELFDPVPDLAPDFQVIVLYEDFWSGLNARKLLEDVFKETGLECRYRMNMWKFNLLALPELQAIVAADTAAATIVCLAAHHEEDLPSDVVLLVSAWLRLAAPRGAALIMLLEGDEEAETSSVTGDRLRTAAAESGVAYFRHYDRFDDGFYQSRQTLTPMGAPLTSQGHFPRRHWGINE